MVDKVANPFALSLGEIQQLLQSDVPCFPELEAVRTDTSAFRRRPQVQAVLNRTQCYLSDIKTIPETRFTDAKLFALTGERDRYENPYFLKRAKLSAAALRLFLGDTELKDTVQDYIWSICEETNWVLPSHEPRRIDLFAAETGFLLAEASLMLGDNLDHEIRSRILSEIDQRLFVPYLDRAQQETWYKHHSNWNGVCNSSLACAALLVQPDQQRTAEVVHMALAGLQVYLNTAFENDGTSTEGTGYWHYGLMNLAALSEMLRASTGNALNLLASDRMRTIAAYPAKMLMSDSHFATFSDSVDHAHFHPGIIARLAEQTGETSLLSLPQHLPEKHDWRLPIMTRNSLWWDGRERDASQPVDSCLPHGGIAKLVAQTPQGMSVALAIKAGHNAENHNHNDAGSFIVCIDDEVVLTDPGRGQYSRQYFSAERYDNIFTNSYGHSVPRIGGQCQHEGHDYHGTLKNVGLNGPVKYAEVEFARAYPQSTLTQLSRRVSLDSQGIVILDDTAIFAEHPTSLEEALMTWLPVEVSGNSAFLHGKRHTIRLTIESPAGLQFSVESLEQQCKDNGKTGILKRLTYVLPLMHNAETRVRLEVTGPTTGHHSRPDNVKDRKTSNR